MTPLSGRTRGAYRSAPARPPSPTRTLEQRAPRGERLGFAALLLLACSFIVLASADKTTVSCEKLGPAAPDGAGVALRCDVTRVTLLRSSTETIHASGVDQTSTEFEQGKNAHGYIYLESQQDVEPTLLSDSTVDFAGQDRVAKALAEFVLDRQHSTFRASFGSRARGLYFALPLAGVFLVLIVLSLRRARFTVDDAARTLRLDLVRPWPLPTTTREFLLSEVRGVEIHTTPRNRSRNASLVLTTTLGERISLTTTWFAGMPYYEREIARVRSFLRLDAPLRIPESLRPDFAPIGQPPAPAPSSTPYASVAPHAEPAPLEPQADDVRDADGEERRKNSV